jgi:glycosyltransferase involved in cell wall biosynthesis
VLPLITPDAPPLVVSRRVAFPISRGIAGWLKYRKGVAHYIPISNAAARMLRDGGVSENRMTVVASGIDFKRFSSALGCASLRAEWGVDQDTFLIGTVAAFEREKGCHVLLEAAKRIVRGRSSIRFVWLGRGSGEERLRAAVDRENLGRSVVVSRLSSPLEHVLPLFQLFVLPSLSEGLSTAVLAALAAGVPVIASDTGGIPELLGADGGLLVPPGDAGALARAISDLIESGDRRKELRGRGIERAREYDISRTIDGTIEVYRSLLGGLSGAEK